MEEKHSNETDEETPKQTGIFPRLIDEEMKASYLDYAMSVIVGRALPDVRDGLKPVHRRILYAMNDMGMQFGKPHKKCARIVGEVLGKYHPHGDTSVYDALVRMAQEFSLRYPLVDGQGNFGCFTKDTEVLLTDGRKASFEQLVKEHKEGKINYTFTITEKGLIQISKIINPRLTKKQAELVEITLDNGSKIRCTPNHKFLLKNNTYKEAQFLQKNESLAACYIKKAQKDEYKMELHGYRLIFQPKTKKWEFIHHLADKFNIESGTYPKTQGRIRHHIDFNKDNNNPDNIKRMNWKEHWNLHASLTKQRHKNDPEYVKKLDFGRKKFWKNEENKKIYAERLAKRNKDNWKNPKYREKKIEQIKKANREYIDKNPNIRKEFSIRATKTLKKLWKSSTYRSLMKKNIIKGNKNHSTNKTGKVKFLKICKQTLEQEGTLNHQLYEIHRKKLYPYGAATTWITGMDKYFYNKDIVDVLEEACENHKVTSVTPLDYTEDVYDLTINTTHNFALGAGIFVHNSVDGDSPAAMRYTEARMQKITNEILYDIEKETVNFVDNFDASLKEPTVLPTRLPNLLINGSSGIAVGMATNIPPHNLKEIGKAVIAIVDNEDINDHDLLDIVQGPDFPTGAEICGIGGSRQGYLSGRGKVIVRAIMHEENKHGKVSLVVTEIPYMVNKAELVMQIAENINDKKIEGIRDLRDESDRNGTRIVIELKQGINPEVTKNLLYKHTRLQTTFGMNMIALVNNVPKLLTLKEMLLHFVHHRKDVITKRTIFDLKKAEEKEHILKGLVIALNNIDAVIVLVKKAKTTAEAKEQLMATYVFSDVQAQAVLDMRLQRLTNLEQGKIKEELQKTQELIIELKSILASEQKIKDIIKEETNEIILKYGEERRTRIAEAIDEFEYADLIDPEDVVITISNTGYIKRIPLDTYKAQNRGGVGIRAAMTKENDFIEHLFIANTHSYLLFFTDKGKVYWKKVYYIPEGTRQARGRAIINLIDLEQDERVSAVIGVKEFDENSYLMFATKNGIVKKTSLMDYSHPRVVGIKAIVLDPDDKVVNVLKTNNKKQLVLATKNGIAVRFKEQDVRPMGRVSRGVKGISLKSKDEVVGMVVASPDRTLMTITQNGYGKRTNFEDYRLINRGGSGVRNIICSQRNGNVIGIRSVAEDDEVMVISKNGIIIRTEVSNINIIGRNTQGVRIMRLRAEDNVVSIAKIINDTKDDLPQNNNGKEMPDEEPEQLPETIQMLKDIDEDDIDDE